WALWPRAGSDPTPTTLPVAVETTTTTTVTTTTSAPTTSSTTTSDSHGVTSVEEAEEILRSLWFGWFEGIYNQDEDRIREVVGTQTMLDAARAAFQDVSFVQMPTPEGVDFIESETLFSSETCLVVWSRSDASFLAPGEPREGVDVLRWLDERWVLASTWTHREDLWEADCEADLEPLS
ncbi:MAG TPA: hypothetical protein VLA91_06435, partial [Acidimicrobiia bacterium]|nr:hypothetical protein [Acidimicrobiia bacterium]